MTDEEEQEHFDRKAKAVASDAGCCLLELFIAATVVVALLAFPAGLLLR